MNSDRDFETTTAEWLNAGSDTTPPHVIDAVLLAAKSTPQERDYRVPLRTPTINKFLTISFGSAAVIVITLVVGAQFFGSPTPNPAASTTEPSSSASVATSPLPRGDCRGHPEKLEGGTYRAPIGGFSMTMSVPTGWTASSDLDRFSVRSRGCLFAGGVTLDVSMVSQVYSTLCDGQGTAVEAGSPAAVTAALAAQTGHQTSGPSDTTIAGYPASRFEFSLPGGAEACNGGPLWRTPGSGDGPGMLWDEGAGSSVTVYVVDVNGSALAIAVDSGVPDEPADVAELDAIVDSLRIELPGVVPIGVEQLLNAGSYSLSGFPVGITFEVPAFEPPAEWFSCSPSPVEQGVCHVSNPDEDIPAAVTFQIVDNVRTPPCSDQETAELLDPPVGPSVDDLVTAIYNLEGYEASSHELFRQEVTVSGFRGTQFTLWAPGTEGCTAKWATAERTTGMVPNEINEVYILDVDGVRVVITVAYHHGTPSAAAAAALGIIESVQIQP